jgi:hypothetical protein
MKNLQESNNFRETVTPDSKSSNTKNVKEFIEVKILKNNNIDHRRHDVICILDSSGNFEP